MDLRAPLILCLLAAIAFAGCVDHEDHPELLGTFYPTTFLLEKIAAGELTVGQLTPEGVEPHDWEPAVQDIARLEEARLVVAVSPRLETYLDRYVDALGGKAPAILYTARAHGDEAHEENGTEHPDEETDDSAHDGHDHDVDVSDAHDLWGPLGEIPHDPHTWLSPHDLAAEALLVGRVLEELYPTYGGAFLHHARDLADRLEVLAGAIDARLATCSVRHIITQHDSFGHLGSGHNITIHPVAGLSPEAEPDAATVRRIIDTMREHGIKSVFVDAETRPAVMASIAAETGATVRTLSPLESRTAAERAAGDDYFDIMERNIEALAAAMECT